jgi:exonuclease III
MFRIYFVDKDTKIGRLHQYLLPRDRRLSSYLSALGGKGEKGGKPVVLVGDMNVGHLDIDIHNVDSVEVRSKPGTTARERESFSALLAHTGFVDAFRHFYPGIFLTPLTLHTLYD